MSKALNFCKWHLATTLYAGFSFIIFMYVFTDWIALLIIFGAIVILYEFFSHVCFDKDPSIDNY